MRGVIYKYTSPSNKIYIGQTLNEYMRRAMWKNIKHPYAGVYINRARKKYGYNSFRYEVIASIEGEDEDIIRKELNRLERKFISLYGSDNPAIGYNLAKGGLGHSGNKTAIISDKCRIACIKANTGRKQSKETIHKRYLSDPRHRRIKCFDKTGKFIKLYFSLKEAAVDTSTSYQSIQRVLKGLRRSTKNLVFRYAE